jgi:hypothetical protein
MRVATGLAAVGGAVASSRDLGTALAFGFTGLAVTSAAIAGIVALARVIHRSKSTGVIVASILGIVCLLGFVLVGLLVTGCGAIMAS